MMEQLIKEHPLNARCATRVGGRRCHVRVIGYVLEGTVVKVIVQYEEDPLGLGRELTGRLKPRRLSPVKTTR